MSDPGRGIWEVAWVGDGVLRARRLKPEPESLQRIEGIGVRPGDRKGKWDPRSQTEALALQMPPEMSRF